MNTDPTSSMIKTLLQSKCTCITQSLILYILAMLIPNSAYAVDATNASILAGKNIYQHGKLSSGKDLIATTIGDVMLTGEQAACINCHRHSGLGSIEGSTIAPAITGNILFNKKTIKAHRYQQFKKQSDDTLERPAYTKNSLKNTLLTGTDINGHTLDKLMPRYTLAENDLLNLYAYLDSLSINDAGVTDTTLHIATIVDERASTEKINTMLSTLKRFITDLNAGTRGEVERTAQAPIQKEWLYGGYRKYKLHIWRLTGGPDTWQEQLISYYNKNPVFSIVSGISKDNWNEVDKFCNLHEIPCILPNIRTPGFSDKNFYTLYFSSGPYNDASVMSRYLDKNIDSREKSENIIQLYDDASYSKVAQNTLYTEATSKGKYKVTSLPITDFNGELDISQYITSNTTIVIWADKLYNSLINTLSRNSNNIKSVYIPHFLATSASSRKVLEDLDIEVLTSYPYVTPSREPRATIRSSAWAKSRKVGANEKEILTNTFTAIKLLMSAIKHVRSHFNRAYIIEILEHKLDQAVVTGMYPKLSIGPNQRYASRGGYIMKVPGDATKVLQPISEWLLPEKQVRLTQQ